MKISKLCRLGINTVLIGIIIFSGNASAAIFQGGANATLDNVLVSDRDASGFYPQDANENVSPPADSVYMISVDTTSAFTLDIESPIAGTNANPQPQQVLLYYDIPNSAPGNTAITIYDGDLCRAHGLVYPDGSPKPDDNGVLDSAWITGGNGRDYPDNGVAVTQYSVARVSDASNVQLASVWSHVNNTNNNCNNTLTVPASAWEVDPTSGLYAVKVLADGRCALKVTTGISNCGTAANRADISVGYANSFRYGAPAGFTFGFKAGGRFGIDAKGRHDIEDPPGDTVSAQFGRISLPFAPDCKDSSGAGRAIGTVIPGRLRLFDPDNHGTYAQPEWWYFKIRQVSPTGAESYMVNGSGVTATDRIDHVNNGTDFYPYEGSGSSIESWVQADFRVGYKYYWEHYHVSDNNTISFELPFNSINEKIDCAGWTIGGSTTATLSDGTTITNADSPKVVDVGSRVTFTHSIVNNGPGNTDRNVQGYRLINTSTLPTGSFTLNSGSPPGASQSLTTPQLQLNSPGRYCERVGYQPSGQSNNAQGYGSEVCVIAVVKPVLQVNGGDVVAGSGVENPTCTSPSAADIITYDLANSGGQLAAFASGSITGFATARAIPAASVSTLAFANTGASPSRYGGDFNPAPCISADNRWVSTSHPAITASGLTAIGDGYFKLTGSLPNTQITIPKNAHRVVYVSGDLVINNDILYDRSDITAMKQIPAIKFIVEGNIYIQRGVRVLNGIYAANGTIYTCSNGLASWDTDDGAYYSMCSNQLTVNGVFIANKINFGRTTRQDTVGAGEIFNYLPELWLAPWPTDDTASQGNYDGITSLPPVL